MEDIKKIEWNIGAVIATALATGFITLQVYIISMHLMGLGMIGAF